MTRIWGAVQAAGWRQASGSSQQGRGPAHSKETQGLLRGASSGRRGTTEQQTGKLIGRGGVTTRWCRSGVQKQGGWRRLTGRRGRTALCWSGAWPARQPRWLR